MRSINERGFGAGSKPKVLEQFERKVYFDLMGIPSMAFWEFSQIVYTWLVHPSFCYCSPTHGNKRPLTKTPLLLVWVCYQVATVVITVYLIQLLANENRQPCTEVNGVIERRLSGAEQAAQAAQQVNGQKSTPKSERRFSNPANQRKKQSVVSI